MITNLTKEVIISPYATDELRNLTSGKVIKNIHYVGDELWKVEIK